MSTYVDEKLAPQRPSDGGRAKATRKQLLARWGSMESVDRQTVVIESMGPREVWRHVSGDLFEQEPRP